MSKYAMDESIEIAVLQAFINLAARYDDDWQTIFEGGPATDKRGVCGPLVIHPAARLGSVVDDVMVQELRGR
jgi:hypothetical protein